MYAYVDGRFVDAAQPHLHLSTQGLQYGTAAFEGIRAYTSERSGRPAPFAAAAHFERLHRSCETLSIQLRESVEDLVALADELIERNRHGEDCYVRPVAYKTTFQPGARFGVRLRGVGHGIALTTVAMASRLGTPTRLGVSSFRRVSNASIPSGAKISGSYVAHALAVDECTALGYDDALLLTQQGRVAEASTSNIIVRHGEVISTPSLDQGILPGITRRLVLEFARRAGHEVLEREIELSELLAADEVLLVGTGVEISPVIEISRHRVGAGEIGHFAQRVVDWYHTLTRP